MTATVNPIKAEMSATLTDAIASYLAKGGKITRVDVGPQPVRRTKN